MEVYDISGVLEGISRSAISNAYEKTFVLQWVCTIWEWPAAGSTVPHSGLPGGSPEASEHLLREPESASGGPPGRPLRGADLPVTGA